MTQRLETTDDQTVFCVVQSDPRQVADFGRMIHSPYGLQIFNYHGPPHIVMEWSKTSSLVGRVYSDRDGSQGIVTGVAEGPVHEAFEPVVCGYVYSSGNQAQLYDNGLLVAESEAPLAVAVTSQKYIGAHFDMHSHFVGDLAEILVYNTALNQTEVEEVSRYLMDKYQSTVGHGDPEAVRR